MSTPVVTPQPARKPIAKRKAKLTGEPDVQTLFGAGDASYSVQSKSFAASFALQSVLLAFVIWASTWVWSHKDEIKIQIQGTVTDISPTFSLPQKLKRAAVVVAGIATNWRRTKGALPKRSLEQITPPAVVLRNDHPKLAVELTVVVPPEIKLPSLGTMGDPHVQGAGSAFEWNRRWWRHWQR